MDMSGNGAKDDLQNNKLRFNENETRIKAFLNTIKAGRKPNGCTCLYEEWKKIWIYKIPNYRSIRRLAQDWPKT